MNIFGAISVKTIAVIPLEVFVSRVPRCFAVFKRRSHAGDSVGNTQTGVSVDVMPVLSPAEEDFRKVALSHYDL